MPRFAFPGWEDLRVSGCPRVRWRPGQQRWCHDGSENRPGRTRRSVSAPPWRSTHGVGDGRARTATSGTPGSRRVENSGPRARTPRAVGEGCPSLATNRSALGRRVPCQRTTHKLQVAVAHCLHDSVLGCLVSWNRLSASTPGPRAATRLGKKLRHPGVRPCTPRGRHGSLPGGVPPGLFAASACASVDNEVDAKMTVTPAGWSRDPVCSSTTATVVSGAGRADGSIAIHSYRAVSRVGTSLPRSHVDDLPPHRLRAMRGDVHSFGV